MRYVAWFGWLRARLDWVVQTVVLIEVRGFDVGVYFDDLF